MSSRSQKVLHWVHDDSLDFARNLDFASPDAHMRFANFAAQATTNV